MPGPFVAMAVAGPASRLVGHVGHRPVVVPGALVWAAGMAFFVTTLGVQRDFLGGWLPGMVILGIGAGLTFPTLSGAAVGSVPGPRFAVATSLNSVARQLGAALGVAVLIAIIGTPTPFGALHAFEHGWLFAGGCFLAGSLASLALVLPRSDDARQSDGDGAAVGDRVEHTVDDQPRTPGLPSLAESEGEHAAVMPQTTAEFLRKVPVFTGLSVELLEQIAELASDISLRRGEWLFREGDPADGVYVVRVGHLEVLHDGPAPQTVNTLTRGAVLGELALLTGSARSASIRALRDTELLKIDKAQFDALLRSEPELALGLTRALSGQLQASRALPVVRRARPVTIALHAIGPGASVLDLADELSQALCEWGKVAVLYPGDAGEALADVASGAQSASHFGPLIERCELDHDQVIMVCGYGEHPSRWDEFCVSRADRVFTGTILLTHVHWDHTLGLPFFTAGDRADARVTVVVPEQESGAEATAVLAGMMSPPYFPIEPTDLQGQWTFASIAPGAHEIEEFDVLVREIPHKGGRTFGYRLSDGRSTLAYLPDHCPTVLGAGPDGFGEYHAAALELAQGADVLVHDAQLFPEELASEADWGHATADYAVELARRAHTRAVVLFHHRPDRTDEALDGLALRFKDASPSVTVAAEGVVIDL